MLNAEEPLLHEIGGHSPRVESRGAKVVDFRRKSLKCGVNDRAGSGSCCQWECRCAVYVAPAALVMRIEAQAEGTIGVVFGVPRRVENAVTCTNGPLLSRRPGNTNARPEFLVIGVLDGLQAARRPSIRQVALPAEEDGSAVKPSVRGIRQERVVIAERVEAHSPA